ncbi:DNA gyrase subunit A [Acetoanaerobium pronyense]|uniref:DNA topoisomerase (ATP-hydrolyzing) n=1 Tax=Acetoanaerobium pronyense TaxID=1482736 RepID=A0ABS4KQJ7_9FIRM|nr:DNA topoisomerase (ATP-hydrolyzing) [Acetoanaerobium pronyense]MBP2028879.1 DNA gyrase subunit A [Acetoanaerobium pronyense]
MPKERLIKIDYEDEMKQSYIDYSMSVIIGRAIPDVRDGLKPGQRRILYAMSELNLQHDKQFRKSARIVGDVLGKFHPHGDSAVYETMVRMSQDFKTNIPLVLGHGNFGSIDGDSAAAMRYTEAKLTKASHYMLNDLDKNTVDFQDNFDGSVKEPKMLPALFPNLLVNGTEGIAVGMSTTIPPHNPSEVIKAIVAYLDNEDIDTKGLMKHIKGPDFPTGGLIVNKDDLHELYETGRGTLRIRSKIDIEDAGSGRKNVVISEIPYTYSGNKIALIDRIIGLMKKRGLDEATDVRDESSREGTRIVVEVKKGADADKVIAKLYKKTPLEDTLSPNFLVVDNNLPKTLSLKGLITAYVNHQKEINERKYNYLLMKSKAKKEVLDGLVKAYDIIDLIIEILRGSKKMEDVKNCLMGQSIEGINFKSKKSESLAKKLDFTEMQTNAILDMKLQKLIGLEFEKIEADLENVKKDIALYEEILSSVESLKKHIKENLLKMEKDLKRKRLTSISNEEKIEIVEEEIEEEVYVLVDKFSYMKVVDQLSITRASGDTLEEYKYVVKTTSLSRLILFTEDGSFHQIKIKDIPKSKLRDKGSLIDNIIPSLNKDSNILFMTSSLDIAESKFLFLTKKGNIKIVDGPEFDLSRRHTNATKLEPDDEILLISMLSEQDEEIVMLSSYMHLLRFSLNDVANLKRNAVGVTAMKLGKNETIITSKLLNHQFEKLVLKSKDSKIEIENKEIPLKKRAQKGISIKFDKDINLRFL